MTCIALRLRIAGSTALCAALSAALPAAAAPFTPANDAEIVERLPGRASDPSVRRVESLRKQLAARPDDETLRVEIARRYFDLAMAQGDPRYVGYATATLAPFKPTSTNAGYWLARGLVQQYSHDFDTALASLTRAVELDPRAIEPRAWRSAIFMVQARYPQALAECEGLKPIAEPLFATGCAAYAQAASGQLQPAYDALATAVKATPGASPDLLLWDYTRLAEMAARLQRPDDAEAHFKRAFALGITDQFLLAAYADFLIERKRPAEAVKLLVDWERSDILLLRLAFAGRDAADPRATRWITELRDRFEAAARRGDRLHEQEAARFALEVEAQPAKALELAVHNYGKQKEPRDADMLLRAALAAKQPAAAQPALDWLRTSGYEDPALKALADRLVAQGAKR